MGYSQKTSNREILSIKSSFERIGRTHSSTWNFKIGKKRDGGKCGRFEEGWKCKHSGSKREISVFVNTRRLCIYVLGKNKTNISKIFSLLIFVALSKISPFILISLWVRAKNEGHIVLACEKNLLDQSVYSLYEIRDRLSFISKK